jgi:hypothetical protein
MSENQQINAYIECKQTVPNTMLQYADLYVEFFDYENIDTAVRIGWCESRGESSAYREDNGDTGVMQFVSWTWNWVAEEYDLPMWDDWVIMRYGRPYDGPTSKSSIGFEQVKVQHSEYYNIMFGYLLSQEIYGESQWRDWSSSQWCWENDAKYIIKLRREN